MITKRILVPSRLRRPPATGWSWTDGRFVREHMDHLSREAVLLYFFLSAVADVNGLSFYSDGTAAARLRMPLPSLFQARDELLAYVEQQYSGANVVVGAGSVVRGTFPDHCVIAGVPARIVRRYVPGSGWMNGDGGSAAGKTAAGGIESTGTAGPVSSGRSGTFTGGGGGVASNVTAPGTPSP